jgi:thioredoxin-disulfide reductase/thioredoxin
MMSVALSRLLPLALALVLVLSLLPSVQARPAVRDITSSSQFTSLLAKHRDETGLPVIVDFYSDGCGPCRMIAPAYKALAKEYDGRAVFVKVDVNKQHAISSQYGVRSMPTFVFLVDGKKVNEFSGAGEAQLRQFTKAAVDKAERSNVMLTVEALTDFYAVNDPMKDETAVEAVHSKCVSQSKSKKNQCVGGAAAEMVKKLKKKYGKGPKVDKRFATIEKEKGEDKGKEEQSGGAKQQQQSQPQPKKKASPEAPNLHMASKEELEAEIAKRIEAEREAAYEAMEDDEDDENDASAWSPGDFPERVTIVGAGPAGLAAAIYAARAGLTPVIVAPPIGGQLQGKGVDVENYPGLPDQTGPGIVSAMREQAVSFGAKFEGVEVIKVDATKRPFKVVTNTSVIETHTVIVATGADSKWLGVPGEWELRGGGVSSCATCDGFLFKDQHVLVVGGGDTAMEDALVLARTSEKVTVVHRRGDFRASAILAERVKNHDRIDIVWDAEVVEILGKTITLGNADEGETVEEREVVSGAKVKDVKTGETTEIACAAVFVAIGHVPNTAIVDGLCDFEEKHAGYLKTIGGSTATSVAGIFAAGDSADAVYRQAITSAGSGAAAALDAERYLSENGLGNEAAEFEAELLKEMMGEESEKKGDEGGYNAYGEGGNMGVGKKESTGKEEKKEAKKEAPKAAVGGDGGGDDEDHMEL